MINRLAKQAGFIKRIRKLPASSFVNTLMFSFTTQANTSLPDITADLNQQFAIDISKEALHKKFTTEGVDFLKSLLKVELSRQFNFFEDKELKKHFPHIKIKDSSNFPCPTAMRGTIPDLAILVKRTG